MKNLYEVMKTVRFELKPVQEKEQANFEQSKKFMESKFLKYGEETQTKEERNKNLRKKLEILFSFSKNIYKDFSFFLKQLQQKNIPFSGLEITSQLLEHFNSEEYHRHKKGTNKTKFVELQTVTGDHFLDWFFVGFKKHISEIRKFETLIKTHQLWEQSDCQEMQSAARWYADIESFAKRIEEFETFLFFLHFPKKLEGKKDLYQWSENQKQNWQKSNDALKDFFNKQESKKRIEVAKNLREGIKENAFVECGMISMNEKALNKNPQKIEQMKKWLEKLLGNEEKNVVGEQEKILQKIRLLDQERKNILDGENGKDGLYKLLNKESEKWVQNETDTCSDFAIYLLQTPKFNQDLHKLKTERVNKMAEIKDLRKKLGSEDAEVQQLQAKINELSENYYRLKIQKGLIQDRKRIFLEEGILSFKINEKKVLNCKTVEEILQKKKELNSEMVYLKKEKKWEELKKKEKALFQISNFQYVWESKFKTLKNSTKINFLQIRSDKFNQKDLEASENLQSLHQNNTELIRQKRNLSQQYGNNKSLINSLQREIERQGKIEYQAVLVRDKEFYYLAFLERENRKELWKKSFIPKENSDFQVLEYERLTFKALEKLALIENATFTEFDELKDQELARKLRETYESVYKEKQFLEYKLTRQDKQYCSFDKIKMQNFAKEQQEKIKKDVITILVKVIEKLGYNFVPKANYKSLDDFASDVNLQCYKTNWINIDKEKLFEVEKNEEIALFKIHNKDFSRAKRTHNNRKNNLFTEYWLDLFEKENPNIRILPEIDLFKKRKEKDSIRSITTKRNKQEIDIQKNRFTEDKFYAAFRLQFYPEKISPTVEEYKEKVDTNFVPPKYFLGLDRGENELLTYCLIDEQGKVVVDEKTQKPVLGDWNTDIDFDVNGNELCDFEGKESYADKLKKFKETREELLAKARSLDDVDEKGKQEIYEELAVLEIQESETVKTGFCAHVLEQINEIMKQYKNVYIVMEDLDIEKSKEDKKNTNKEETYEKLLGASAYQVIEDAIINKFKYYQTKNNQFHGEQFVPNIERIRDLREVKNERLLERNKFGRIKFAKSKDQIGNILFVNEFLTSQMCPECGFCICGKENKERAEKFGKPIYFEDMQEGSFYVLRNGKNGVIEFERKQYEIKHFKYCKESVKTKFLSKDQLVCENILKPRLKSQKDLLVAEGKKDDKFFCSCCRKNTEEENFEEPLCSGDDIAAYNVAKRGLKFFN